MTQQALTDNTSRMGVYKSVLIGPVSSPWLAALKVAHKKRQPLAYISSRRDCLLALQRLAKPVVILGAVDGSGIPTLPFLSQLFEKAPGCAVVCLHDEPVVLLPSAWNEARGRAIHHILRGRQSHLESCIAAWKLVGSLLRARE